MGPPKLSEGMAHELCGEQLCVTHAVRRTITEHVTNTLTRDAGRHPSTFWCDPGHWILEGSRVWRRTSEDWFWAPENLTCGENDAPMGGKNCNQYPVPRTPWQPIPRGKNCNHVPRNQQRRDDVSTGKHVSTGTFSDATTPRNNETVPTTCQHPVFFPRYSSFVLIACTVSLFLGVVTSLKVPVDTWFYNPHARSDSPFWNMMRYTGP